MKGIILAGGYGTRLAPLTNIISKQLLPVYDKPMICYPLATLMNIGVTDILIISTPQDTPNIEKFLGDGSDYGIRLFYAVQDAPRGIADAFLVGENFIGKSDVCLILGDNIFYGSELVRDNVRENINKIRDKEIGAYIFAYRVSDPERYGVVEFDENKKFAISIEEKPKKPKSNWAVTGFYIYNNNVVEIAKQLKPSMRGELEITDLANVYLQKKQLGVIKLKRGFAWLDAGTHESLLESSSFIHTIEKRQGLKIACLEEVSYRCGLIECAQFENFIKKYKKGSDYRKYLESVLDN
jgi:glucose-1-phosphate thymidylyltransferase